MPVSRVGTASFLPESTTPSSTGTLPHTAPSGTTLLMVSAAMTMNRAFDGATLPTWGGVDMTLVRNSASGTGAGDVEISTWGIVSPVAATADVVVTWTNSGQPFWVSAVNYDGTVVSSVGAAIQFLTEDINNTATATSVHASGGTAGNGLIFVGAGVGDDMIPASNASSYIEVIENNTGGGEGNANDLACYIADLVDSAPSAITVTWGVTDENNSHHLEIVAAAAATGNPWYYYANH